jgi:hypothetical protein
MHKTLTQTLLAAICAILVRGTFAAQMGGGGMIAAAHHSMMEGKKQLYDPIYGVRSDGVAYCSLGNINAWSGRYDIEFDLTSTSYQNQPHVFGAHGASHGSHFLWHLNNYNNSGLYDFGNGTSYYGRFYAKNNHVILGNNSLGRVIEINGSTYLGWSHSPETNNNPFLIFRANNNSQSIDPAMAASVSIVVVRALKVWYGDNQVADLIACKLKNNNEIGFWNSITNSFVGNIAGSGSLIEVAAS